ncbi:putative immunity protein [Rhodococcus sp. DMU2021]|uniref:putative immunity protein n=1 Tax=Rhodococcus sp. DMU2021 TaxID=2866997 RepID=UPI0035A83CD4
MTGDFELTMDELRAVVRYVTESAQDVLPVFEESVPEDRRPRSALDAAREFVDGAPELAHFVSA